MKKNYILLFLFSFTASLLKAQDEKAVSKLALQYGVHFFSRQDQLFSPMVYHAASPVNLNIEYSNESGKRLHKAEIEFTLYDASWHDSYDFLTGFDKIKTQTTLPSGFTVVSIRYAYLRNLKKSSSGTWWIGGIWDNQINSIDNEYGPAATFGYFAHFSLAPIVTWRLPVSAHHSFNTSVWVPVISWIARSSYAIQDDEYMLNNQNHNGFKTFWNYAGDGNLHLMNRYQQLNFNLGYNYSLSHHWKGGAEYRFEFFRDSKPKTVISYQNFFNIKVLYQF